MPNTDCYFRLGLSEELGRHRGREGIKECEVCGDECESVSHTYVCCGSFQHIRSSSRVGFFLKLQEKLGNGFECIYIILNLLL